MQKTYKNILVIKMSALGDIFHALPSLHALRELYPDSKISWLVEPQFQDVLPGKPYIDNKIIFHKNDMKKMSFLGKLSYLSKLRKELHSYDFDLVIDLQGLMKSTLIVMLSGAKERIGYSDLKEGSGYFTKRICGPNRNGHVVERYLDVIRYLGANVTKAVFPLPDTSKEEQCIKTLLAEKGLSSDYVLFFPGSAWATKEWPVEAYAGLAEKFSQKSITVVLAGAPSEKNKSLAVRELVPNLPIIDITGETSILELIPLTKNALMCIGGDTGPLHISIAAGTPTVTVFGPSNWDRTCPYGELNTNIVTTAYCAPCLKRICPKVFICMDLISVDAVFDACKETLSKWRNYEIE